MTDTWHLLYILILVTGILYALHCKFFYSKGKEKNIPQPHYSCCGCKSLQQIVAAWICKEALEIGK